MDYGYRPAALLFHLTDHQSLHLSHISQWTRPTNGHGIELVHSISTLTLTNMSFSNSIWVVSPVIYNLQQS